MSPYPDRTKNKAFPNDPPVDIKGIGISESICELIISKIAITRIKFVCSFVRFISK